MLDLNPEYQWISVAMTADELADVYRAVYASQ
jgi:hypothetical protein